MMTYTMYSSTKDQNKRFNVTEITMQNTILRQSLGCKDTVNESKPANRKRKRPQKDDICDKSTDHKDLTSFQNDAEKLRQSHTDVGLSPVAKARSLRPRVTYAAHKVTTRPQINKNERGARANKEATLNDSDETTTSDDSSEGDPSDASDDVSMQVKHRNLLGGPKAIPSPEHPKQSLTHLFNCDDCGAHFLSRRSRNGHTFRKRHYKKLITCEKCNFQFHRRTLDKHVKLHHLRLGLGRENFKVIKQVKMNNFPKISSQLFKCEVCGAHFLTRSTRDKHVRSNRHVKKLIPCEKCKLQFTSPTLDKHIEIHHSRLELRRENLEVVKPYHSKTKAHRRHGNTNRVRKAPINKKEAEIVSPDHRINEVMCKENNTEQSSINEETTDLKKSGINSKATNSFSDTHNVEVSISHNKFYGNTLNESCVNKHMRCRVVIENAMVENINRYIVRKTVHSNGNKTSESVYPSLEDGNPKMPHNDVCDDVVVGYIYGGLSIKTESEDKDIVLKSDDGPENEKLSKINVKEEVEHNEVEMGVPDKRYPDMNDEIYFVKDEVEDDDESNIDDIDVPDGNGPEIKIYKVEHSDPVLMSVQTRSVTAENNDISVKIKDVFSIPSIEPESQATGEILRYTFTRTRDDDKNAGPQVEH